jgi:hypothetical protein
LSNVIQMYSLLFFLPIYYRVIKERSPTATGVFLLSQTLAMALCAGFVLVLVQRLGVSCRWAVLLGWFCTAVGMGLLALLGSQTEVVSDVLLNLPSGFGIGILMQALVLSSQASRDPTEKLEALIVLIFMRYLGSASGLVTVGLLFQHILRGKLNATKFESEAEEMTKYATTLMYSIRRMSSPADKLILVQATEATLRTIWLILAAVSLAALLLSCAAFISHRESQVLKHESSGSNSVDPPRLPPLKHLQFADGKEMSVL